MQESQTGPDAAAVIRVAGTLGRALSPAQADVLAGYLGLLSRWRRKINLVGPADWETMLAELVADSWHLADFLSSPEVTSLLPPVEAPLVCLDFGAGAGLPGLPLRAFWNRGPYILLEAREKRAVFLGEAVARLALAGLSVAEGRVEVTVPRVLAAHPGAFVLCLGRAFAPWPEFLAICRELVRRPMAVLTMTGEAPGGEGVPTGFRLAATTPYAVRGKTNYLSFFASAVASM